MIIGSTALRHHFPDQRKPKDLDVIDPQDPKQPADRFWDERLLRYASYDWWNGMFYASIDQLYTLKVSHSYWELPNGSWGKHMRDVQFLKSKGAKLNGILHDILYEIWEDRYGKKKMKFMGKDEFFEDAVTRIYDHDSLHDSVAYGDEAMYIQTLKKQGHTAVDMVYIRRMKFEDQVKLYREEVCATALERIVVPRNYHCSAGAAYLWALRRTITSLTKGWSARFIVDNYQDFAIPCDYVVRHLANKEKLILL